MMRELRTSGETRPDGGDEGAARDWDSAERGWPLAHSSLKTELPDGGMSSEVGGETVAWSSADGVPLSDEALGALLGAEPAPEDADAERWVRRLADQLARLDALNVAGMLAAATEGGGARLGARLAAGGDAGAALAARLARLETLTRAAPAALHARSGAARADASARALLHELRDIFQWLEAPALRDLDCISEVSLATSEGRAQALGAAQALRTALRTAQRAERTRAYALRLAAVRERLRRLARARDQLAAALARHLNNALIHLGNEAAAHDAPETPDAPTQRRHHAHLQPYAPFMRWLKDMDEKAYDGLVKVYVSTWARVYEREVRGASEAARAALAHAPPERADDLLDEVLTLVENICNAEQDFCTQFFCLDVDVKSEEGEGGVGEASGEAGGEAAGGAGGEAAGEAARRGAGEARRLMAELFPALDTDLVALVAHIERHDPYGAMRALACVGRRVLGDAGDADAGSAGGAGGGGAGGGGAGSGGGAAGGAGEARWARAALAAVAVAAKRGADRAVAERLAALPDAIKQAARKPKCGVLSFIPELEEMSAVCEAIFSRGRRADLDRWYVALAAGMARAVAAAEHPRTPRAALLAENYHRLHRAICALRVPALDALRKDTRQRYNDALRAYVTQYFGRPLDKLTQFFEGVSEAIAMGAREDEVCYRAAFSKHELRRLLAMYPAHEVRKSLHRLYRTVEKHLSEEGGLLQVVWRAMQEEFIAQHVALQARIAACYAGAGLALPLSTQDILDAFSDIAREH